MDFCSTLCYRPIFLYQTYKSYFAQYKPITIINIFGRYLRFHKRTGRECFWLFWSSCPVSRIHLAISSLCLMHVMCGRLWFESRNHLELNHSTWNAFAWVMLCKIFVWCWLLFVDFDVRGMNRATTTGQCSRKPSSAHNRWPMMANHTN